MSLTDLVFSDLKICGIKANIVKAAAVAPIIV
jgi:hypothetical protein